MANTQRYRDKACRSCSRTFTPTAPAQTCCSPECRAEDRRRQRREARQAKTSRRAPAAQRLPSPIAGDAPAIGPVLQGMIDRLGPPPQWFDPDGRPIPGVHPEHPREVAA